MEIFATTVFLYILVALCDAVLPKEPPVVFYIAGLYSTAEGRGVLPAVKLAVEHVNTHLFDKRGFKLEMCWEDTKVCQCAFVVIYIVLSSSYSKQPIFRTIGTQI